MIKIILKHGREDSLRRFHPWVFSGAIAQIQGSPAEGDIVGVYASDGTFLAAGHYQIGSIAVRILSFDSDVLSPDFWKIMIARALQVRIDVGLAALPEDSPAGDAGKTDCYRLVHGEGDNLPGLIIDYYDGVCVMQAHSVGMFRARKQISEALQAVYGSRLKAVYDKVPVRLLSRRGSNWWTAICISAMTSMTIPYPFWRTDTGSLSTGPRGRRQAFSSTRGRTGRLWKDMPQAGMC